MGRVATAVWRIRPEVILALDEHLGPPVDSYVNGSQTWFSEIAGTALEWRLHPVAGYRLPKGLSHYDVWDLALDQLMTGVDPGELLMGKETRSLASLWDGLECFAAHGGGPEPAGLAAGAHSQLGLPPDAVGLVDHDRIGDAWERARGTISIVDLLLDQLTS